MKIRRKSWHYRWRAHWMRRHGWPNTIEWQVTRREYVADMVFLTVFLPLNLLLDWLEKRRKARPKRKDKPCQFIMFIDCGEEQAR